MGIDCTCTIGWSSDKVEALGDPTGLDPFCPIHHPESAEPEVGESA